MYGEVTGIFTTIFFVAIIIFIASILKSTNKTNANTKSNPPKNESVNKYITGKEKPQPPFVQKRMNAFAFNTYCPYCNTKISSKSRKCVKCKTGYICPNCRKCTNFDQHFGI